MYATDSASVSATTALSPDLGFGRRFTAHQVRATWTARDGWGPLRVEPYGPLALDPATSVLHYGQAVFEGLKAYRQPDGGVAVFRPEANARRLAASAERLAMPALPEATFLTSVDLLVRTDIDEVPGGPGESLYLRPFLLATGVGLGVRPSDAYEYVVIASPVGSYFPDGLRPLRAWVSTDHTRAAPGGTGAAKCAGNYAAAMAGQALAAEQGCDQVVWLDAVERRWIDELGAMNLFVVRGAGASARLCTPPLSGSLLPGITRDAVIALARDAGLAVAEEPIGIEDWRDGCRSGEISEAFACGTAAVIAPVGEVRSADLGSWTVGDGQPGPVAERLRTQLLGLQHGTAPDPYGWMRGIGGGTLAGASCG